MSKKKEFVIEYDFQSSPQLLFQYLSTASGLSEWFSDDVNYRGEKYTFFWGDSEEYARVLSKKINEKIKFQWINGDDDEEDYFFEFKIQMDEIANNSWIITNKKAEEIFNYRNKNSWNNLIKEFGHKYRLWSNSPDDITLN